MGFFRRRIVAKGKEITERRSAPFLPSLKEGETILVLATGLAEFKGRDVVFLAATEDRILWYYEEYARDVTSLPYGSIDAFLIDPGLQALAVGVIRPGLLSVEVARGDIHDVYVWRLFPGSQFSTDFLQALIDAMRRIGKFDSAVANGRTLFGE